MLLRLRIAHCRSSSIPLLVARYTLLFLHLLILLHQRTTRTAQRGQAVIACVATDTVLTAHAAAGETLQERLKTAASENATAGALEGKQLERIRLK